MTKVNIRKQRVLLNDQYSSWANVEKGVLEGTILGLVEVLIKINDLSGNLSCNPKLFAAGKYVLSVVRNKQISL